MLRPAFGPPQGEPEGATLAELRLHADGAAVQLDQAFREREAEARPFVAAALARVDLHELLKQLALIRRRDPDAGVAHGHRTTPESSSRALSVTRPPSVENLMALESRLRSTWRRRPRSAVTTRWLAEGSITSVCRRASSWARTVPAAS